MKHLGIDVTVKHLPPLDPAFIPLGRFYEAFLRDAQEPFDVAVERSGGQIGTYETSVLPYEDCCTIFVAKHPVTKPSLKHIQNSEAKLDSQMEELVKKAVETREVVRCI